MGSSDHAYDPKWAESVWDGLASSGAVSCKGPKMALCRWLSWLHCSRHWDPLWHRRLFVLLVWGLSIGYVQGDLSGASLRCNKVKAALSTHGDRTLKVQEKTATELIQVGKNTMHSVTLVYLQSWQLQRKVRALMVVGRPLERWYHEQHLQNRSDAKSLEFYGAMAGMRALQPLRETCKTVMVEEHLRFLGFVTQEGDLPMAHTTEGALQGLAEDEAEFTAQVMRLLVAVVGQRLRSLLWHLEGVPGLLPALVSGDERLVLGTLEGLRSLWTAHQAARAEANSNAAVLAQVNQCFLSNPIPLMAMELLADKAFQEVPEDLAEAIRSLFSLGQTVICEQANRVARNAETREQDNCRMNDLRLWMLAYRQGVLSRLNSFDEVLHSEHSVQATQLSQTPELNKTLFVPSAVRPALPLQRITSNKTVADYVTTSPQNAARSHAYVAYWRHCVARPPDWHLTGRLWLSQLLCPGMIVARPRGFFQDYFLVVTVISQTAALAWKLRRHSLGPHVLFTMCVDESVCYEWLVVLRLEDLQGFTVSWVGQAWKTQQQMAPKGAAAGSASEVPKLPFGLMALQVGKLVSLPELAAWHSFRGMSSEVLKQFCIFIGLDHKACSDEFDLLSLLLRHYLPKESERVYEELLGQRRAGGDEVISPDFFGSEEVRDAFDEDDLRIVDKWRQDQGGANVKEYTAKLAKYKAENEEAARAKAKPLTQAAKRILKGKVSEGTRLYPKIVAAGMLSREDALSYLPPQSNVYKSALENRWRLSWGGWSRSRAWSFHGELEAFGKCAAFIWKKFESMGGERCPFEWIVEAAGDSDGE